MKTRYKQTVLFLAIALLGLPSAINAQSILTLDLENFDEAMEYFEVNYGNQMQIPLEELAEYLLNQLTEMEISEDCSPPETEITQIETEYIAFQWEEVPNVEKYQTNYINLHTGESGNYTSDAAEVEFDILEGLYLFGFQSLCEAEANTTSSMNIIIVDKDIMFNGPTEVRSCNCPNPTVHNIPIVTSTASGILPTASMYWSYSCDNISKYKVNVQTTTGVPYESEFVMAHEYTSIPEQVYFLPMCFIDFTASTESPVFFGDAGQYFVSFNSGSKFTLHFTDLALASKAIVEVQHCECSSSTRNENNALNDELSSPQKTKASPNPFQNEFKIEYNLTQAGKVHFELLNTLGQSVFSETIVQTSPGNFLYQPESLHHLPSGIYTIKVEKESSRETLKLIKTH